MMKSSAPSGSWRGVEKLGLLTIRPAGQLLEEAIRLDRETENLPGLAADLVLLVQLRRRRGDPAGARELYQQARTLALHTRQPLQTQQSGREEGLAEHESGVRLQQGQVKSIESVEPDGRPK